MTTSIEWTRGQDGTPGRTWNPVRGCIPISPGCKHCYAKAFAERFRGVPGHPYEQGFDLRLVPHKLHEPLTWTEPCTIFVNSMSDLFHADLPIDYTARAVDVMELATWHTFQVLTKRADLLLEYSFQVIAKRADHTLNYSRKSIGGLGGDRLKHVWFGVSVEDRKYGLPRIELLRQAKVHTRFLSIEPLLEDLGPLDLRGIEWVIVGGESGAGARPMHPDWVRSIRDQCITQGVKFFFKQWGGVRKKKHGRVLDGRTWDEMPARPVLALPSHKDRQEMIRQVKSWARGWQGHELAWRPPVTQSSPQPQLSLLKGGVS